MNVLDASKIDSSTVQEKKNIIKYLSNQIQHKYQVECDNNDIIIFSLLNLIKNKYQVECDSNDIIIFSLINFLKNHIDQTSEFKKICSMIENVYDYTSIVEREKKYPAITEIVDNTEISVYDSRYEQDFIEIKKIGNGGFGKVYESTNKMDGVNYAIKKIHITKHESKNIKNIFKEAKILAKLSHPNVIRYFSTWIEAKNPNLLYKVYSDDDNYIHYIDNTDKPYKVDGIVEFKNYSSSEDFIIFEDDHHTPIITNDDLSCELTDSCSYSESSKHDVVLYNRNLDVGNIYIQMELCSCTLDKYLYNYGTNNNIVTELLSAVEYIHSQNIIHCDISLSNILITVDSHIKLSDFGLAEHLDDKEYIIKSAVYGTPLYNAPESKEMKKYSYKSDIYSLGLVLFEIASLFTTDMERMKKIEEFKNGSSNSINKIICKMVSKDENERPSISQVLEKLGNQ